MRPSVRILVAVVCALVALALGAADRVAQGQAPIALDSACYLPLQAAVDSVRKKHLASTPAPTAYQTRAMLTLTSAHTLYCARVVTPPPPVPGLTLLLSPSDSVLRPAGHTPAYVRVSARVDSAGVQVSDSAAFTLSDTSLARARWKPQSTERWFEVVRPTRDGVLYVVARRGAAADSVRILTRVPIAPPPVDTTTPPPSLPGVVVLPQAVHPIPTDLRTRPCTITAGTDLQAALNAQAATSGPSVLCLAPQRSYRGVFVIPARADTGWRIVRTDVSAAAVGTRMRPSASLNTAKIIGTGTGAQSAVTIRGSRVALIELEIAPDSALLTGATPILAGEGTGAMASDIVLERLFIHGHPGRYVRRGILIAAAHVTVRDSWIDEIHDNGADSQAIGGWDGGPVLIENNHLAGASENILFGGANPQRQGGIIVDATIRGNHIFKPIAWKGRGYAVKNLTEFKAVRRVLVEGNIFDGSWAEGQVGGGIVIVSSSQDSNICRLWCRVTDVTVRGNIVRNVGYALGVAASQGTNVQPDSGTARVHAEGNLFERVGIPPYDGENRHLNLFSNPANTLEDVAVVGNTFAAGGTVKTCIEFTASPNPVIVRFRWERNICDSGTYGPVRSGVQRADGAFALHTPGAVIGPNHYLGAVQSGYAMATWGPTAPPGIGVDVTALRARLAGVVVAP